MQGEADVRPGWLFSSVSERVPADGSGVGEVVRWYRQERGLTQVEAARLLHMSQSRLSKIESGTHFLRDVHDLRFVAARLGIPPERFGLLPDASSDDEPASEGVSTVPGLVRDSQRAWLHARRTFTENRIALSELAAGFHAGVERVAGTPVLSCGAWLPDGSDGPVALDAVRLRWLPEVALPSLSGASELTEHVRLLSQCGGRYLRYSRALRDLDRPKLECYSKP